MGPGSQRSNPLSLDDRSPLEEPINAPKPLRRSHQPILIGGGGERRTLQLDAAVRAFHRDVLGLALLSVPCGTVLLAQERTTKESRGRRSEA